MRNSVDLAKTMQQLAVQSIQSTKPMAVVFGEVISTSPLKVKVDQKLELTKEFLLLTTNVMDYEVDMTVNHQTGYREGGSGEASFASHNHDYVGKKKFLIHNGLKQGDQVIMLRDNGGQKYVIIDKVVNA